MRSKTELFGWMFWAITVFAFVVLVAKYKSPQQLAELSVGVETTMVHVTVYDTVTVDKDRAQIAVHKKITAPSVVVLTSINSLITDSAVRPDSAVCYSITDTTPRGTFIRAEMCSESFPLQKPADLSGSIQYKEAPDTVREVLRVDTLTREVPAPVLRDWKTYGLAATAAAAVVAILILLFGK